MKGKPLRLRLGYAFNHAETLEADSPESLLKELNEALIRYRSWYLAQERQGSDKRYIPDPPLRIQTPGGGWVNVGYPGTQMSHIRAETLADGGESLWQAICETAEALDLQNRELDSYGSSGAEAAVRIGEARRPNLTVIYGGRWRVGNN